jgi:hypothetical protein
LLSDAAREITGQTYTVVGGRIALWSQPREIKEISKDGRWTPQELAERIPADVGFDRLPMLDYMDMMKKRAAEAGASEG